MLCQIPHQADVTLCNLHITFLGDESHFLTQNTSIIVPGRNANGHNNNKRLSSAKLMLGNDLAAVLAEI